MKEDIWSSCLHSENQVSAPLPTPFLYHIHTHLTLWKILIYFGQYEADGIFRVNPSLPSKADPATGSKHTDSQPGNSPKTVKGVEY